MVLPDRATPSLSSTNFSGYQDLGFCLTTKIDILLSGV
jgi:hypothetical protein